MNSRYVAAAVVVAILLPVMVVGEEPQREAHPRSCDVGPIAKTYGDSQWIVFSCDDNKTVVIIAVPGSEAMPFVFSFYTKDGKYQLTGEGTGSKISSSAAFEVLRKMTPDDIAALIDETRFKAGE